MSLDKLTLNYCYEWMNNDMIHPITNKKITDKQYSELYEECANIFEKNNIDYRKFDIYKEKLSSEDDKLSSGKSKIDKKNDDLILNPLTKRYVKKSGIIGKKILSELKKNASTPDARKKSASPPAARKKSASPPAARKKSASPPAARKKSASPPAARKKSISPKVKSSSSGKQESLQSYSSGKQESLQSISPIESSSDKLESLQKQMNDARNNRDIKKILELNKLILEKVKKQKSKKESYEIPTFLKQCIDPTTNKLPILPTMMGDSDMKDIIINNKHLIIIDGLCYDIKELYELIKVDISQGNIWGCNPYIKRDGLVMPFSKDVKDRVLAEGIKRDILPKNTIWENKSILNADDIELRGNYKITVKKTPLQWLNKNWGSDKTAFPTPEYYSILFEFPYRKIGQNPGRMAIFPKTIEVKEFIDKKLIPVYEAGALWSKKISLTTQVLVINPNIHLVFEDNQPNRWHANKMKDLEEEISRYSPAFL
jgi:hypothetical protein